MKEFIKGLNAYLNENRFYNEAYLDYDGKVVIEIEWGDWKHDHLRANYLVRTYCADNGKFLGTPMENITEEDGSDCYSAIHTYRIK